MPGYYMGLSDPPPSESGTSSLVEGHSIPVSQWTSHLASPSGCASHLEDAAQHRDPWLDRFLWLDLEEDHASSVAAASRICPCGMLPATVSLLTFSMLMRECGVGPTLRASGHMRAVGGHCIFRERHLNVTHTLGVKAGADSRQRRPLALTITSRGARGG